MTGNDTDDTRTDGAVPDYLTETPPVDHGFVCESCGHRWYYTRRACPECRARTVSTYQLTTGDVVTWTTVGVTPPDVREPNRLAVVRFGDVQLIAQLEEDEITAGETVEFTGEHRLRGSTSDTAPRLTRVEK